MSVTCALPGGTGTVSSDAGSLGGNSQTGATNTGVGQNSQNRFGGGNGNGNEVSQNRIFISTQGIGGQGLESPDWNAWVSLEGRGYAGNVAGYALDLVGGIDRLVTPDLLVGGLVGVGRISLRNATSRATATAPMVGPYIGYRTPSGLIIDGFATFARPFYEADGGRFAATRYSLGLTVTGSTQKPWAELRPFGSLKAFSENQPTYVNGSAVTVAANSITSVVATGGVRMNFTPRANGFAPYVGLAADFSQTRSTASGTGTFFYPRLSAGFRQPMGGGQLNVDADFGKSQSRTFDKGLKVSWEFKF